MRTKLYLIAGIMLILTFGCSPAALVDQVDERVDMAPAADLAPTQPSCPAANGLAGDVLLCADFAKTRSLEDPSLANWNFRPDGKTACWQIADSLLTNLEASQIGYNLCGALLPAIDLTEPRVSQYKYITLSINYSIDANTTVAQLFSIYLASDDHGPNPEWKLLLQRDRITALWDEFSHRDTFLHTRETISSILKGIYRPYIYLYRGAPLGHEHGWKISSIAVIGSN